MAMRHQVKMMGYLVIISRNFFNYERTSHRSEMQSPRLEVRTIHYEIPSYKYEILVIIMQLQLLILRYRLRLESCCLTDRNRKRRLARVHARLPLNVNRISKIIS